MQLIRASCLPLGCAALLLAAAGTTVAATTAADNGDDGAYSPAPNDYQLSSGGFGFGTWTEMTSQTGGGTFMAQPATGGRQVEGVDSFAIFGGGAGPYAISRPLTSPLATGRFHIVFRFDLAGEGGNLNLRTGNDTSLFATGELLRLSLASPNNYLRLAGTIWQHDLPTLGDARGGVFSWSVDFDTTGSGLRSWRTTVENLGTGIRTSVVVQVQSAPGGVGSFAARNDRDEDVQDIIFDISSFSTLPGGDPPAYTFRRVDDTSTGFISFGGFPSVNDAYEVAYIATFLDGTDTDTGVFRGSCGPGSTQVARGSNVSGFMVPDNEPDPFGRFDQVGINGPGTVSFFATKNGNTGFSGGFSGIYTGTGTGTTEIRRSSNVDSSAAINNGGTVSYVEGGAGAGIFAGDGTTTITVADSSGPFAVFFGPAIPAVGPVGAIINNNEDTIFYGITDAGVTGIFMNLAGSALVDSTMILDGSVVTEYGKLAQHSVNDAGEVVFLAELADGRRGVFVADASGVRKVADNASGSLFTGFGLTPSINNRGEVGFLADTTNGVRGIFLKTPSGVRAVVKQGDAICGVTATPIGSSGGNTRRVGINNVGALTFWAGLADGRSGIFLAAPVPRLDTVDIDGSDFVSTFLSAPCHGYQLQVKDDPLVGVWTGTGSPITGDGTMKEVRDANGVSDPVRFYRLSVLK